MPTPNLPEDVDISSPVPYDSEAFGQSLRELLADANEPGAGSRVILFHGGTRERRQAALATLTHHATANVHQFRVPSLLDEQRMQTQNNLRKAFDHAAEESALLYFDSADALFTHSHVDTDDVEESPEPTTAEYFFDRVVAYDGVVVLSFHRRRHVEWAEDSVHLIVRFD